MKPKILGEKVLAALNQFLVDSPVQFAARVDGSSVTVSLRSGGHQTDVEATWSPASGYSVNMEHEQVGDETAYYKHLLAARAFVLGFVRSASEVSGPRLGVAAVLLTGMSQAGDGWNIPKILMGRRTSVYGRGTWGIPGGAPELGESFVEAVVREFREETGAGCTVVDQLGIGQSYGPDYATIFYRVRLVHQDWDKITALMNGDIPEDSHDKWEIKEVADVVDGRVTLFSPAIRLRDLLATRLRDRLVTGG